MWTVITLMLLNAAIESLLVGLSAAALSEKMKWLDSMPLRVVVFWGVFGILSAYYIPAIHALDATITIGNAEIAREIGPGTPIKLTSLFEFSFSDPVVWLVQAGIASLAFRFAAKGDSIIE